VRAYLFAVLIFLGDRYK